MFTVFKFPRYTLFFKQRTANYGQDKNTNLRVTATTTVTFAPGIYEKVPPYTTKYLGHRTRGRLIIKSVITTHYRICRNPRDLYTKLSQLT